MSVKTDYSAEEWAGILTAPYLTGMLIVVADPNLGFFGELGALTQGIQSTVSGSQNEVLKAVAAEAVSRENQEAIKPRLEAFKQEKDPAALLEALQTEVVRIAGIVSAKSAEDGEAFKRWLVYLAEQTAEGSKEGGFLGISAVRVSEKETQALADLRSALGVPAA
jgi:hypothetical protein